MATQGIDHSLKWLTQTRQYAPTQPMRTAGRTSVGQPRAAAMAAAVAGPPTLALLATSSVARGRRSAEPTVSVTPRCVASKTAMKAARQRDAGLLTGRSALGNNGGKAVGPGQGVSSQLHGGKEQRVAIQTAMRRGDGSSWRSGKLSSVSAAGARSEPDGGRERWLQLSSSGAAELQLSITETQRMSWEPREAIPQASD